MSKKTKKARRAVKLITDSFTDSAGPLSGMAHIDLYGNKKAQIDGCKGIIEYSNTTVKLNIGKCMAVFSGSGLELGSMSTDQASLTGQFDTIRFE